MEKLTLGNVLFVSTSLGLSPAVFANSLFSDPAKQDALVETVAVLDQECHGFVDDMPEAFDWQNYDDQLFWSLVQNIQDRVGDFCYPPELEKMQSGTKIKEF